MLFEDAFVTFGERLLSGLRKTCSLLALTTLEGCADGGETAEGIFAHFSLQDRNGGRKLLLLICDL